jgi:bifunctional DNA-binding transcriptional regulator/antitoxin component of YhaV-PrlF toxin-antitoxin module
LNIAGRGDREELVIDEELAFYGRLFDFELRGKSRDMAFIDLGDQFLALQNGRRQPSDDGRHFGLVVADKEAVRQALSEAGVEVLPASVRRRFRMGAGSKIEVIEDGDSLRLRVVRPVETTDLKGLAGLVKAPVRGIPRRLDDFDPATLLQHTRRDRP